MSDESVKPVPDFMFLCTTGKDCAGYMDRLYSDKRMAFAMREEGEVVVAIKTMPCEPGERP